MNLIIQGELDDKLFSDFLLNFNKTPNENNYTIWLNSSGGWVSISQALISFINQLSKNSDVTIIAFGEIYSAAFDLFYKTKCRKIILPGTIGMCHSSYIDISINESGKPDNARDKIIVKEMKKQKEETIIFCTQLGMSSIQINLIKRGKDVYFNDIQMIEMLKNTKYA